MLDELRTLFLAALFHSDTHSAIKLINEWNDACDRIQKIFDNMTDKNPNLEEIKLAHWIILDECANEGVYCSACNKKVYRINYSNKMKMRSPYCPNCGAKMDEVPNG